MSNRRIKSLAADDDDLFDDYDDDDDYYDGDPAASGTADMTDEDVKQMQIGTARVRQALGPAYAKVPIKDIEDALWNYYYDVDKSVAYLKSKHKGVTVPPNKTTSVNKGVQGLSVFPTTPSSLPSTIVPAGFWADCPWLQVPLHRQALIVEHPALPVGRLLGGAPKDGKMSKLQALAAKRLQQADQKASPAEASKEETKPDDYTQSLEKLRISQAKARAAKLDEQAPAVPECSTTATGTEARNQLKEDTEKQNRAAAEEEEEAMLQSRELRAQPSAFASILTKTPPSLAMDVSALPGKTAPKAAFDFSEPSPDDVVNMAQTATAAPKPKIKEAAASMSKAPSDLSNSLAQVSIVEPVKVKSKNIDVVAEYKKNKGKKTANFVVIGHVDAGKSTLMGRLLYDLNAVDQRTLDKYKKEADRTGKGSFAFAWVLDQGSEERERGVTIDIATNKFDTGKTSFTILDAPGHRDFVPNMIAGASQADFAVLVVDASIGNFESGLRGQTKEHAILARSIGVQKLIVAVNKMDTVGWSQERFQDIRQQILTFLLSVGFQAKNVSFVPCSGFQGGNILRRGTESDDNANASWYTGPTLVELLDSAESMSTFALDKPLRMTISDVFRGGIQNPLSVSGRIEAGNLQVGEAVVAMPSGETAHIKALEVDEEPQEWAVAGQNVTLHLAGSIDPAQNNIKTGDVLCSPSNQPIRNVSEFKARLLTHDYITPMAVDLHRGRLHVPGSISKLIATLDKASVAGQPEEAEKRTKKKKPKIVPPQSWVRVLINLDQPVPLESPARVVLRSNGETVATGIVEE